MIIEIQRKQLYEIDKFLIINGFVFVGNNTYKSNKTKCLVFINFNAEIYEVKKSGGTMYSKDLNIYWLIGCLMYHEIIIKLNL